MLLMIDNYDSFTYNVVQYLAELGADVQVYRNDEITIEPVSYTHLRAHETLMNLVCRLLLEKTTAAMTSSSLGVMV